MDRMKRAALAVLCGFSFFAAARVAHAAADPITIETKWNENTASLSTTSVTAFTFDVGGFGANGYAVAGTTHTSNGTENIPYGQAIKTDSTTVNVVGFSYSVYAVGANATFTIAQTLKTPPPGYIVATSTPIPAFNSPSPWANSFSLPVVSTSAAITVPAGTTYSDVFQAVTSNPVFTFSSLNTSASYYITVQYGYPRRQ